IWGAEYRGRILDNVSLATPRAFREWILKVGGLVWCEGEKPLQHLQLDIVRELVDCTIMQVPHFGYHEGHYFFDDAVIDVGGKIIPLGEDGFFRVGDSGYLIGETGLEEQHFVLGRPKMHPELTCTYCSTDEDRAARSEKDLKPDPVRELFLDFSHRVQQTLCGD